MPLENTTDLFVANLPYDVLRPEIEEALIKLGCQVKSVQMFYGTRDGRRQFIGRVRLQFYTAQDCYDALPKLKGARFGTRRIFVTKWIQQPPRSEQPAISSIDRAE